MLRLLMAQEWQPAHACIASRGDADDGQFLGRILSRLGTSDACCGWNSHRDGNPHLAV